MSGYFYFVRYWAIYVLQLFVNQVVTSLILKLTVLSNQVVLMMLGVINSHIEDDGANNNSNNELKPIIIIILMIILQVKIKVMSIELYFLTFNVSLSYNS